MKKLIIPKKIRKMLRSTDGNITGMHHYTYIGESKYVLIYRCDENGAKECFQKKDFLVDYDIPKRTYPFKEK